MDAKTEAMAGNQHTGMCGMDPGTLLAMYMQSEQCEAALYAQLAQMAPTPCLQRMITKMTAEDANQAAYLAAIAAAYGLGTAMPLTGGMQGNTPMMPPQFYSLEAKKEEEK